MPYKGMIFDFNGVLLEDSDFNWLAWQSTVAALFNNKILTINEFDNFQGRNNRGVFEMLFQRKIERAELNELSEFKEEKYRALCLQSTDRFKLNDGAIELFEYLKNENIDFTIATSADKNNLDFYVQHLKLDIWFDLSKIIYADGLHPGKPMPDSYILAAQKINLDPSHCVVLEDSFAGIRAAKSAKIGHIIGYGPHDKHPELLAIGANQAIAAFKNFPRAIFL
jgi:HAD superfamily hydrolase (TIGR01509 family)